MAGLIATIGAFPLLAESLWFTFLPVATAAFAVWAWRSGTDATQAGLKVRALLGSREIAWSRVAALVPEERKVVAALTGGGQITLTAVRPQDLPKLVEAGGGRIGAQ
jgi:hypothetical protein